MKDLQLNLFDNYENQEEEIIKPKEVTNTSLIDYLNAKYNGIFVNNYEEPEMIDGYFNNGFSFCIWKKPKGNIYEISIYFNGDLDDVHQCDGIGSLKKLIDETYNSKKSGYQLVHCGQCWMHNTDRCYSLKYHITGMKDENMCGNGELFATNLDHFEKEICEALGEYDIAPCSDYGILNKDHSFFNCKNKDKLGIKCTDCQFCYDSSTKQDCYIKKMHWAHAIWQGNKK